jgi:ubiquinone/menaquinone biosynthesis C-methylase UbiE
MKKKDFVPALRFDWLTGIFDPFIQWTMPEKRMRHTLMIALSPRENDKVLDFGCGTGTMLVMLKEHLPNIQAEGIDIDEKVLAIAEEKARKSGVRIDLRNYDGQYLPYNDNAFDKVLSSLVFHHLKSEQKLSALKEIYRVLKSDGELHIMDFGKVSNKLLKVLFFPWQALDGIANTQGNVQGKIPEFMKQVGFRDVTESERLFSIFGIISFYKGVK